MLPKAIHLFVITLISVVIVTLLYLRSINFGEIEKSGFKRLFLEKAYIIYRSRLPYNSYYFAGANADSVYLGNVIGTTKLLIGDSALSHFRETELHLPDDSSVAWAALQTMVIGSRIVSAEQITPRFFRGDLSNENMNSQKAELLPPISAWIPLFNDSYIFRMYDTLSRQYDLFKWAGSTIDMHSNSILEKQGDGTFSVDGTLLYDDSTSRVIYAYYYRNQILVLDSSLKTIKHLKTIDTVAHANVQTAFIASTKTMTLKYPALIINKRATADNGRLYVHSLRQSDNQSSIDKTVIDCYDIISLKYLFSFFIDIDPKLLSGFKVVSNRMYAIAGTELFCIRLIP